MPDQLSPEIMDSIVGGYNSDPFAVLGPHPSTYEGKPAIAVRTFLPWAETLQVAMHDGEVYDAWRIHPEGLFEAVVPGSEGFGYLLRATNKLGGTVDLADPYSFG